MSTMLLSLLIKARDEASTVVAKVRQGLLQAAHSAKWTHIALVGTGLGLVAASYDARRLAENIGQARARAQALTATLLHGSLGAAAMAYAFKKGFLDIAVDSEKARVRLRAIEETAGRAEAAMATTKLFRDNTALTLADVREAWIQLRTRGVRPTETTLTAIADAATATGKTMARAAEIVGEVVQGGGNMQTALRDFGIETKVQGNSLILQYRYLGQVLREVVPKDNKLLLTSKLVEILGKKFGGAAKEASVGWEGLLLRMGESWKEFALDVMDKGGVFGVLKSELDNFITGGKRGADGQAENARSLADAIKELIRAGFAVAAWVRDGLPGAIRAARDLVNALGGLKPVLLTVLAIMATPLIASLLSIAGSVGTLAWTIIRILIPSLMGLAFFAAGTLIPVIYSLGAALLGTPVGWIIMAIAALIAGAWLLYENWDQVTAFLSGLWDDVSEAADDYWQDLQARAGQAGDWIVAAWQAVAGFFMGFGSNLKSDVAEVWQGLGALAGNAADLLVAKWEPIRAFFAGLWADIRTGFDAAFGWITGGIDKLKSAVPSLPTLPSAGQAASAIGDWAKARVDGAIKIAVDVTGPADARVIQSRTSGPVAIDTTLGQTMAFP